MCLVLGIGPRATLYVILRAPVGRMVSCASRAYGVLCGYCWAAVRSETEM